MKINYESLYKTKADDDLIVIAVLDKALFLPDALAAAREELLSRGIDPDSREALDAAKRIDKHRNRFQKKAKKAKGAARAAWDKSVESRPIVQKALASECSNETRVLSDMERGLNAYQAACVIIKTMGLFYLIPILGFASSNVVLLCSGGADFHDFVPIAFLSFFILCLSAAVMVLPDWFARHLLRLDPQAPPWGDFQASPSLAREIIVLFGLCLAAAGCLDAMAALESLFRLEAPQTFIDLFDNRVFNAKDAISGCVQAIAGLLIIFGARLLIEALSLVTPSFAQALSAQTSCSEIAVENNNTPNHPTD